jgi:thiamine biosynthesis protein ThiS
VEKLGSHPERRSTMTLTVNGNPIELPENLTATALLAHDRLDPGVVVLEVNGRIIHWANYTIHFLNAKDQVEIVRLVGGG